MKCKKCGNPLFKIEIRSECQACIYNGAYDEEHDLIYNEEFIEESGLTRTEVEKDGECSFGTAYGTGCYIFTCSKCEYKEYLPLKEE